MRRKLAQGLVMCAPLLHHLVTTPLAELLCACMRVCVCASLLVCVHAHLCVCVCVRVCVCEGGCVRSVREMNVMSVSKSECES